MTTKEKVEKLAECLSLSRELAIAVIDDLDDNFHEAEANEIVEKMETVLENTSNAEAKARSIGVRLE